MYNRYLSKDKDAFDDLYTFVESAREGLKDEYEKEAPVSGEFGHKKQPSIFSGLGGLGGLGNLGGLGSLGSLGGIIDFKKIFKAFHLENIGIVPILLVLFLTLDADDDEKLIIIALAFLFGI